MKDFLGRTVVPGDIVYFKNPFMPHKYEYGMILYFRRIAIAARIESFESNRRFSVFSNNFYKCNSIAAKR